MRRWIRTAGNVGAVAFVAWLGINALTTPWRMRWGSTDEELRAALPGDEPIPGAPTYFSQHAITIDAPVPDVWPWLAQLGTDRGGFYSYAWLENLFGAPVHNADTIHPEWQHVETGGFIMATPPGLLGLDHPLGWKLTLVEPERVLVLENWGAFVLLPTDSGSTRFLVRTRNAHPATLASITFAWVGLIAFEPAHFIMQRGMLRGVKARAERLQRAPADRGAADAASSPRQFAEDRT